jgi:hypothetical protein
MGDLGSDFCPVCIFNVLVYEFNVMSCENVTSYGRFLKYLKAHLTMGTSSEGIQSFGVEGNNHFKRQGSKYDLF